MVPNTPLVITMGEPGGVGPELIAAVWREMRTSAPLPFCVTGSTEAFTAVDPDLPIETIETPSDCNAVFERALPLSDVGKAPGVRPGCLVEGTQKATIAALDTAVDFALSGEVSGIVTAPIHKAHLLKAGFTSAGHTDYLAERCGQPIGTSVMMLTAKDLRVVPVTVHIPLADVSTSLTHDRIVETGLILNHDLKHRFGIKTPRITVAGLNPHAGEDGMLGHEEATRIVPAIRILREDYGLSIDGPYAADTLFHEDARKTYDAALCMYHDQALIPLKTLDFWGGVNVTLGLPFIRTSPDHGTALSHAGKGTANLASMRQALLLAAEMTSRSHGASN